LLGSIELLSPLPAPAPPLCTSRNRIGLLGRPVPLNRGLWIVKLTWWTDHMPLGDLSSAWRIHGSSARPAATSTSIPTGSARVCAGRWSGRPESSLHIRDCSSAGEWFLPDRAAL